MSVNHDQLIDELIKRAIYKGNLKQIEDIFRKEEIATVESLTEVTGLPKEEIEQILEEARFDLTNNQYRENSNAPEFYEKVTPLIYIALGLLLLPLYLYY